MATNNPTSPTIYRGQNNRSGSGLKLHFTDDPDECRYIGRIEQKGNITANDLCHFPAADPENLCDVCWPAVPDAVRAVHTDEEIENMVLFRGWALGTVVLAEKRDGRRLDPDELVDENDRIEGAWIELMNGEGRAGEFGGVKAFADVPGSPHAEEIAGIDGTEGYFETYAFATPEAFKASSQKRGWYVGEWIAPKQPDYGEAAPR